MEERKQALAHMVESAHSIVEDAYQQQQKGKLTEQEAKQLALTTLEKIRYGTSGYVWVNDMHPKMLMHPIKPELNGKDLTQSKDPAGKFLFVEFVKMVSANSQGFVDYLWPKPGADHPIAKISYVKGHQGWGWVIGSGDYIDDIEATLHKELIKLLLIMCLLATIYFVFNYFFFMFLCSFTS